MQRLERAALRGLLAEMQALMQILPVSDPVSDVAEEAVGYQMQSGRRDITPLQTDTIEAGFDNMPL